MNRWILACTIARLPPSLPAFPLQTAMLAFNAPVIPVRYFMAVCLSLDLSGKENFNLVHFQMQLLVLVLYVCLVTVEPGG